MKIGKGTLLLGAAAVATLALLAWVFMPDAVPVSVATVERGPMQVTLDEDGEVRAYERYVVAAPVAGRLLRMTLREGDRVAPDQVVARMAPLPLSQRELGELEARLAAVRALRLEADEEVRRTGVVLEQARRERERTDLLVAQGFLSAQGAEQARVAAATAAAGLEAARHRARSAAAEIRAAEASLVAARAGGSGRGALVELHAPAAAQVLRIHEKSERVLASGAPIATLCDPARFEVVLDYLTSDAVRIRPGMTVLLDNWGGEILRARVRLVEPGAFTKVSALGVEEQRTNVVADFVDPPGPLSDGYRVEGRVVVWESDAALKLPTSSLFRHGQQWAAFAVENGRARLRIVTIGERNALEAQVIDGVREGETVIRHPANELADGTSVKVTADAAR